MLKEEEGEGGAALLQCRQLSVGLVPRSSGLLSRSNEITLPFFSLSSSSRLTQGSAIAVLGL